MPQATEEPHLIADKDASQSQLDVLRSTVVKQQAQIQSLLSSHASKQQQMQDRIMHLTQTNTTLTAQLHRLTSDLKETEITLKQAEANTSKERDTAMALQLEIEIAKFNSAEARRDTLPELEIQDERTQEETSRILALETLIISLEAHIDTLTAKLAASTVHVETLQAHNEQFEVAQKEFAKKVYPTNETEEWARYKRTADATVNALEERYVTARNICEMLKNRLGAIKS
jgi:chromosome segregation ATPase